MNRQIKPRVIYTYESSYGPVSKQAGCGTSWDKGFIMKVYLSREAKS